MSTSTHPARCITCWVHHGPVHFCLHSLLCLGSISGSMCEIEKPVALLQGNRRGEVLTHRGSDSGKYLSFSPQAQNVIKMWTVCVCVSVYVCKLVFVSLRGPFWASTLWSEDIFACLLSFKRLLGAVDSHTTGACLPYGNKKQVTIM